MTPSANDVYAHPCARHLTRHPWRVYAGVAFRLNAFIMRTVYSRHTTSHTATCLRTSGSFFYIGDENISLAPNLAKGGAEQLSGKEKPSRVY